MAAVARAEGVMVVKVETEEVVLTEAGGAVPCQAGTVEVKVASRAAVRMVVVKGQAKLAEVARMAVATRVAACSQQL